MGIFESLVIPDSCLIKMILSVSALLLACALGYRLLWWRRYSSCAPPLVRLRGMVTAVSSPRQHPAWCRIRSTLHDTEEVLIDDQITEFTAGCRLQFGATVTVDGVLLPRPQHALYREPGLAERLVALRIVRGAWPERWWLKGAMIGLVVVISGLALTLRNLREDPLHTVLERIYQQSYLSTEARVAPLAGVFFETDWMIPRLDAEKCHSNFATCSDAHPVMVGQLRCQQIRSICLGQFHPTLGMAPFFFGSPRPADPARPWWNMHGYPGEGIEAEGVPGANDISTSPCKSVSSLKCNDEDP